MSAGDVLPPFDADATCVKCGGEDITASHHASKWTGTCSTYCPGLRSGEHIQRHCRRCRYEWAERPLDYENPILTQLDLIETGRRSRGGA